MLSELVAGGATLSETIRKRVTAFKELQETR